jgi:8-oxo-dGTP pyrophosphatase MutT (NUDIX family)
VGPYNAAEVRTATLDQTASDDEFLTKLHQSIHYWKKNEYSSAWLNVPVHRARIIEALSNSTLGFDLHHTNSTQQIIVMKKWLRDDKQDLIPPFASHQVGCAGFVLNDRNEILLIKEWTGPYTGSGRTPSKQWKLPGGLLDAGESLEEATIREVYEETGVSCDFEGVLAFWHRHGLKFGKSDLYYVCLLKPRSLELIACPVEISDARWMHVDDFLEGEDHPLITHVLKRSFLLKNGAENQIGKSENVMRLKPQAKMVTGAVQWPGRSPYPTYTCVATEK